ncbi:hypothetical protein [Pseudomonas agarici]|uniref:hypothetical protein n=2 Tax=Pseudomonas agarici TaxID=46677 RepID=UPI0008C7EB1C|nr:hypothetical protein [Pseudomonas agarici]NWB91932.1 hypothetical protein [Pseudomonas agarici]NWC11294.1 hypothetical protein [Pseudomonas agarici]SEL44287.1 hypothetical protein SAMN05216604_118102 [Pseudomonas agarici]
MKIIRINFFSKPMSNSSSNYLWVLATTFLFVFSLIKENLLPERFFYDASAISNFIQRKADFTIGDSYASTAAFYSIFSVTDNSIFLSTISAILTFLSFYIYSSKSNSSRLTSLEFSSVIFFMFLSLTFMTMISKDLIVLIIVTPFIYFVKKGTIGLLTWSLLALLYAVYFRAYWFLFIAMFWGVYLLLGFTRKPSLLLIAIPSALLILSFIFSYALGTDLDNFRMTINNYRLDNNYEDTRTAILPWIAGSGPIISWINTVITWFTLIIPIPLIILFSPYYLIISFFIMLMFLKFWKKIINEIKERRSPEIAACGSLIISFTAIQSVFEPDYGSYVRHLAPLYPMVFFVILKDSRSKTPSKNFNNK